MRKLVCGVAVLAMGVAVASLARAQGVGEALALACQDQGATLGILGAAASTIGVASILANFRRVLPAWLVTVLDFLAANWFRLFQALSRSSLPPAAALVVAVLAGGLVASCAGGGGGVAVADALASPAGAALVSGVSNFAPAVAMIGAKVDAGLAATADDKAMVCGGLSWAAGAFEMFGPLLGAAAGDLDTGKVAIDAARALCDGDTGNLAAVVKTVAGAYASTARALNAGGVPVVAVPAPAS